MSQKRPVPLSPAMEKAVNELKGTIAERFPQASFVVEDGFDPKGVYLVTTVDIADTDEVMDVIGDRLVELQVDEGLPIYVTRFGRFSVSLRSFRNGRKPRPHHRCHLLESTVTRAKMWFCEKPLNAILPTGSTSGKPDT